MWHSEARQQDRLLLIRRRCVEQFGHEISKTPSEDIHLMLSWSILLAVMMMMMFIGTETLVTQLVREISRMQAC